MIGGGDWLCRCDCGKEKVVTKYNVINGHTGSCGCLRAELAKQKQSEKEKNKETVHKKYVLYSSWLNIKFKCKNPKSRSYKNFGAKGVGICKEWDESYDTFKEWCFANGWTKGSIVSLVDRNGNFEPNNVVFKTRRDSQYQLEYDGQIKTLVEWAEELNIKHNILYSRKKRGLSDEDVLFGKSRIRFNEITYKGETLKLKEWAEKYSIPLKVVRRRLYDGWSVEEALETPLLVGAQKKDRRVLKITHKGESKSISEWSQVSNINAKLIYVRYFIQKWDAESAIFKPVTAKRDKEKIDQAMKLLEVGDGIDYNSVYNRLNHGWTLEEAIMTPKKRSRNSLILTKLTCRGEIKTIEEWSKISKISPNVISTRKFILKWTDNEDIIFKPITKERLKDRLLTCRGQTKTLGEWSEERGLTISVLQHRLWKKWTPEEALFTPYCCSRGDYIIRKNTEE